MRSSALPSLLSLAVLALPAPAADPDPTKPDQVFGLTRVWPMHLTIQAKDWETMQPARGGFKRAAKGAPAFSDDRKIRGGFGYDFEYVKGDLEIDGKVLKDVGIRFKGNSTYMLTASFLKRPFKVDLDRHHEDQSWGGMKKLTFNNNVMDPTATREPLAFLVYRAAGVPAPRTAFLELTLTVPGKYDKAVVGLYTLIETVDKTFLKDHFPSAKGLLCKPERAGALGHFGEKWASYESAYRPKSTATPAAKRRLIDFTKLVHQAGEAEFHAKIASFLDIDRFLRYVAATVVLSSMDSFVGLGHNYYLYHDPKSNRFTILPWDVDHSFGALLMVGSQMDLFNLSVRQPSMGNNRLIERLLSDEKHLAQYKGHVARLLKTTFTLDWVKSNAAVIAKTVGPAREREKKAAWLRNEAWSTWTLLGALNPPPSVELFTQKRIASLEAQLAGKSDGTVLRGRRPPGPERQLAQPVMLAADKDKDGALSRDEVAAAARELFKACDKEGKGALDQKAWTAGMEKVVPRPGGFFGPPSPAGPLSRGVFARASKEGKLTADSLASAAEALFEQADKGKKGKLDRRQVTDALRELLTPPKPAVADKSKPGG